MSSWITSEWGQEMRSLWNNFDPIGVFPVDEKIVVPPLDEYDSYHGIIIQHLNNRSRSEEILVDLKVLLTEHIGLTWNSHLQAKSEKFVQDILLWFENKKPELTISND